MRRNQFVSLSNRFRLSRILSEFSLSKKKQTRSVLKHEMGTNDAIQKQNAKKKQRKQEYVTFGVIERTSFDCFSRMTFVDFINTNKFQYVGIIEPITTRKTTELLVLCDVVESSEL